MVICKHMIRDQCQLVETLLQEREWSNLVWKKFLFTFFYYKSNALLTEKFPKKAKDNNYELTASLQILTFKNEIFSYVKLKHHFNLKFKITLWFHHKIDEVLHRVRNHATIFTSTKNKNIPQTSQKKLQMLPNSQHMCSVNKHSYSINIFLISNLRSL